MLARLLASQNYAIISIPIAKAVGLEAAFLLHHLLSHYDFFAKSNQLIEHKGQSFFYATVDDIEEKTTLSKERQATAIKKLLEAGLIEQSNFGVPCRRHFAIPENFESVLFQLAGKPLTGSRESRQLDSEKTANCTAEKPPTINSIKNSIKDNTFSKEKDISVFSEKIFESENQPQPQAIEPEKKEKEKKVAPKKEKDETPDEDSQTEDFVALGSLPAYVSMETLKLKGVSSQVWGGFVQSVTKRLGKKRLKRNLFEQWIKKLFNAVSVIPDQIMLEHFVEYECKPSWTSPFFSGYLEKMQKDCKSANLPLKTNQSTTQNQNSQNGTTNQSNSERFEYKPGQVREYFTKTNGLSGL